MSKCQVILGSANIAHGLEGKDTTLEEDDNKDAASVSFPAPNFRDDGSELSQAVRLPFQIIYLRSGEDRGQ